MEIKIQSIHFDADKKLLDFIEQKTQKLSQFLDEIIAAEVFLRLDKSDSKENKLVEIKLNIPDHNIFAKKNALTFEGATELSVEALRKQLMKIKTKKHTH